MAYVVRTTPANNIFKRYLKAVSDILSTGLFCLLRLFANIVFFVSTFYHFLWSSVSLLLATDISLGVILFVVQ